MDEMKKTAVQPLSEQEIADLEAKLNDPSVMVRLQAVNALKATPAPQGEAYNVNNHVHTTFSFSPYSPSAAVYQARKAGLVTVGIMDHDSVSGCREFTVAGSLLQIPTTCGIECRVDAGVLPFRDRTINNPDQKGVVYMSIHAIPARAYERVDAFFAPVRAARGERNRKMLERINALIAPAGLSLNYEQDVLPLSNAQIGGGVTERHLLYALALRLIERAGKGQTLVDFLQNQLQVPVTGKLLNYLLDTENACYAYDVLGLLKGYFVDKFYIPATDECPPMQQVIDLAEEIGAISAYPYLGDVGQSVTGDKKSQKFEDDYLDELIPLLKQMGIRAIAYMPTRNTQQQLDRLRALCRKYDLFEICGEDINQPRQSFICDKLADPQYYNLVEATWAMIAHEQLSNREIGDGMFSEKTAAQHPDLQERVKYFAALGREMFA